MKQRSSFLALVILALSTVKLAAWSTERIVCLDNAHMQLFESKWHVLEDIFITQPERQTDAFSSKWLNYAFSGIAGAAVGTLTYQCMSKIFVEDIQNLRLHFTPNGHADGVNGVLEFGFFQRKKTPISVGIGILSATAFYKTLKLAAQKKIEADQLVRIVHYWPYDRKKYTRL